MFSRVYEWWRKPEGEDVDSSGCSINAIGIAVGVASGVKPFKSLSDYVGGIDVATSYGYTFNVISAKELNAPPPNVKGGWKHMMQEAETYPCAMRSKIGPACNKVGFLDHRGCSDPKYPGHRAQCVSTDDPRMLGDSGHNTVNYCKCQPGFWGNNRHCEPCTGFSMVLNDKDINKVEGAPETDNFKPYCKTVLKVNYRRHPANCGWGFKKTGQIGHILELHMVDKELHGTLRMEQADWGKESRNNRYNCETLRQGSLETLPAEGEDKGYKNLIETWKAWDIGYRDYKKDLKLGCMFKCNAHKECVAFDVDPKPASNAKDVCRLFRYMQATYTQYGREINELGMKDHPRRVYCSRKEEGMTVGFRCAGMPKYQSSDQCPCELKYSPLKEGTVLPKIKKNWEKDQLRLTHITFYNWPAKMKIGECNDKMKDFVEKESVEKAKQKKSGGGGSAPTKCSLSRKCTVENSIAEVPAISHSFEDSYEAKEERLSVQLMPEEDQLNYRHRWILLGITGFLAIGFYIRHNSKQPSDSINMDLLLDDENIAMIQLQS